ncbi:hypothetical protein GGP87_003054 [Salinibacter ruber]|nr:hypothetical protein [Salinibacter ruber]
MASQILLLGQLGSGSRDLAVGNLGLFLGPISGSQRLETNARKPTFGTRLPEAGFPDPTSVSRRTQADQRETTSIDLFIKDPPLHRTSIEIQLPRFIALPPPPWRSLTPGIRFSPGRFWVHTQTSANLPQLQFPPSVAGSFSPEFSLREVGGLPPEESCPGRRLDKAIWAPGSARVSPQVFGGAGGFCRRRFSPFNPRARAGRRKAPFRPPKAKAQSQHRRPKWGASQGRETVAGIAPSSRPFRASLQAPT